jgi:hypothetical protein
LRSAHQNDLKHIKKIFFNKNNFEVLGNAICTAFPNGVKKRKNIVLPKIFEIKERGV